MIERGEQQLGKYRLKQVLGKGAFADVYLGEHMYLNTPVAVKILHSRLDSPTLADFLIEARHISHLVHPHIIRVFDFGLESDTPFLVMDYAPYGNLRQQHPPGMTVQLPLVVTYVMALASALQHAHDQHLVHRDIKPENVLLGQKREVLLCDFGLALLTSHRASLQVRERFGPLAYMAPELIYGQPVPASDQYALAVMVYEWLCGHLPFEDLAATGIANQHLYTDSPSLCEAHPDIPRAVEQVLLQGLSKEPTQRFVDVLSFAKALEEASHAVSSPYVLTALPALHYDSACSSYNNPNTRYQSVPVPLTPLLGRDQELQAMREVFMRPEVRLMTLTGPGGIGKTHLALTFGNKLREAFAQGSCFVSLDSIYDSDLVIPAITHALGLQEMRDCTPMHFLKTYLHDKQLLLVLDSFEQVLSAAPLLADLLSSCPGLKILVTSRALLHVGGEYIHAVQPLEVPDVRHLPQPESLSQVPSVALFVQRTQAISPGFQLTVENAGDIAAICTRLEGMPLAIELAAEQSNLLPPKALLSRLEHPLEVLMGRRRDAPERHLSLLKTLSWNDDLLTPDEQILFRRLAVFVGGCSLQAVETVSTALGGMTSSLLDVVRSLVDKSLLGFSVLGEDAPRFSLRELIRAYALKRLTECGELSQARDAHAAYYLEFAEKASTLVEANQIAQERLNWEVENLRVALEWLLERKKGEKALRLRVALEQFWSLSGYLSEGRSFLEKALEVSEQNQRPVSPKVRAKAHYDCVKRTMATSLLGEGIKLCREIAENNDTESIVKKEGAEASLESFPESRTVLSVRTTKPLLLPAYAAELTAREIEVLRLLATGLSNKRIAERLVLSPHTVNVHIHSIFGKLTVHSRSAATRYALDHQLA